MTDKDKSAHSKYPLMCVIWRDSHSQHGWKDAADTTKLGPIVTVGFVILSNDNRIVLSTSVSSWDDVIDPLTIPKENVMKMWKLDKPSRLDREMEKAIGDKWE